MSEMVERLAAAFWESTHEDSWAVAVVLDAARYLGYDGPLWHQP